MNKIILIGRITKDLELRHTTTGKQVCDFTLAVNRDKDNADFINCVVWNNQAENLCKYQGKGSQIAVVGELRVDKYEVNEERRYKTYVFVNNIEFLQSKNAQNNEEIVQNDIPTEQLTTKTDVQESFDYTDEDLPW